VIRFIIHPNKSLLRLIFGACSFGATSTLYAQPDAAIKVHVLQPFRGLYAIAFEQAFNRHFSADLAVEFGAYAGPVRPVRNGGQYVARGKGVIGELRYYPFARRKVAPAGFFVAAAFRYVDFTEQYEASPSDPEYEIGGNILNIGITSGYKFTYKRFGIEAFLGMGAGNLYSDDTAYRRSVIPTFYLSVFDDALKFYRGEVAIAYLLSSRGRK